MFLTCSYEVKEANHAEDECADECEYEHSVGLACTVHVCEIFVVDLVKVSF
jgi:hypothetical protein